MNNNAKCFHSSRMLQLKLCLKIVVLMVLILVIVVYIVVVTVLVEVIGVNDLVSAEYCTID